MQVVRESKVKPAGDIPKGDTFKYKDEEGDWLDFIVMRRNSCFRLLGNCGLVRMDTDKNVLVYNIAAKCFGTLPANQQVVPTESELIIHG